MKTFILFLLALPVSADAASFCRSPKELAKEILNCDLNAKAAVAALNCASGLQANLGHGRTEVAALLDGLTMARFEDGNRSEAGRVARAERLLDQFSSKIDVAVLETAEMADYTDVMIDYPDGVDERTSAPCFNSAFNSLQEAVSGMDQDIHRSESDYRDASNAFQAWKNNSPDAKVLLAKAVKSLRMDNERMLASKKKSKKKK